jgi:hypothetical protein
MKQMENQEFLKFLESEAVRHLLDDFSVEDAQKYLLEFAVCALESDHLIQKAEAHERVSPLHELTILVGLLQALREEIRPLMEQMSERKLKRA